MGDSFYRVNEGSCEGARLEKNLDDQNTENFDFLNKDIWTLS